MSAGSATLRGRRAEERNMVDRCVVEAITRGTVRDEETVKFPDVVTRVYPPAGSAEPDGPCQFTAANVAVRAEESAGQIVVVQSATLALPMDTSLGVKEGHVARITASGLDPQLVGVKVRIKGPFHQTYATSRRFPVEEAS